MGRRLRQEEIVTIQVLHERGRSNREIGRQLGIDEKAVRYRLSRLFSGAKDGRAGKPFKAASVGQAIDVWMDAQQSRGVNLQRLYEFLVSDYDYEGSYKSVQRYVRAHFPRLINDNYFCRSCCLSSQCYPMPHVGIVLGGGVSKECVP